MEFARAKRLSVDSMQQDHKNQILDEIKLLETKRNHYFNVEAHIEQDSKDGVFLKKCIRIQRVYRGYRSRKFFNIKNLRTTRAQLLKREIIDKLKGKTHEEKIEFAKARFEKEKSESAGLVETNNELIKTRDKNK